MTEEAWVYENKSLLSLPSPASAHAQRWYSGRGFSLRPRSPLSHPPPPALLPALAPGQTLNEAWVRGQFSALSLLLAMAHWLRRALALHLWWALADAPCSGVVLGWALGLLSVGG